MYLFYAPDIEGDYYTLNAEESRHCIRVLRFTEGESVSLVDGKGNWYNAVVERPELKGCGVRVTER